uniref:Metalloendopeptidase n=1 Tax=Panagrolaimus sp. ES5 TaxID=591445 RepID=A0AC34F9I1_9BILA
MAYHVPLKSRYDIRKKELIDVEPISVGNNIVEGDILVSENVIERPKRQALYYIRKWNTSKTISYTFSSQFGDEDKNIIRSATVLYNALTCVKFEENGTNLPVINVVKKGGCYSTIGPLWSQKSQLLSLEDHCITDFVTPLHEFAHALGIFHEHSRYDRDQFIKVYPENTMDELSHNFDKISKDGSYIFSDYDYDSYMHYNDRAFSDAWMKTIDAVNEKYQRTMGQSMFPSASVFKVVNDFYDCHKICQNSTTKCFNEGYPNPNNCDACNCPEGFGGQFCETRANSIVADCGGDYNVKH